MRGLIASFMAGHLNPESQQAQMGPLFGTADDLIMQGEGLFPLPATSSLASTTIARRDPTEHDVQIETLFCDICHSDSSLNRR